MRYIIVSTITPFTAPEITTPKTFKPNPCSLLPAPYSLLPTPPNFGSH
ncbi:hypothetical protein [Moorena sp. SIO3I8]|nr:hypothetical protein [Moorena sp. SIO3I8]NEO05801.1 hypothetical protein [Moorena sp. SIO3I8]